jgi:hypothetical protein
MRKIVLVVLLLLAASSTAAADVRLNSITTGLFTEENPPDCKINWRYFVASGCAGDLNWSLTDEVGDAAANGYNRQSLYVGKKDSPTRLMVRSDCDDHFWFGLNHNEKLGNLTLTFRPMLGAKSNTPNRAYFFADYQPGGKFGLFLWALAIEDYQTDIALGPTYRNKGFSFNAGPNIAKSGCWYVDFCYTVMVK